MQADGRQIIVNPTFQDWVFENEKSPRPLQTSMKRQITYRVGEEIGPKATRNDPWKQSDYQSKVDYGGATSNGGCSRPGMVIFTIVLCLVSIAALVLILLMCFGKMGEGCGCSTSGGKYENKYRIHEGE